MHGTSERAGEILAAPITLRDSRGRDRQKALRSMAATWNVRRKNKVEDQWKDRSVPALAKDLDTAVCDAASKMLMDFLWRAEVAEAVLIS